MGLALMKIQSTPNKFLTIICVFAITLFSSKLAFSSAELTFIVNAENPIKEISKAELIELFLKKKRDWANGINIKFIDHTDGTTQRGLFLRQYLNKTGHEVEVFWMEQKRDTGDAAPIQVPTDSATESLVSSFKGGIGYVSTGYTLGKGVKTITIRGTP